MGEVVYHPFNLVHEESPEGVLHAFDGVGGGVNRLFRGVLIGYWEVLIGCLPACVRWRSTLPSLSCCGRPGGVEPSAEEEDKRRMEEGGRRYASILVLGGRRRRAISWRRYIAFSVKVFYIYLYNLLIYIGRSLWRSQVSYLRSQVSVYIHWINLAVYIMILTWRYTAMNISLSLMYPIRCTTCSRASSTCAAVSLSTFRSTRSQNRPSRSPEGFKWFQWFQWFQWFRRNDESSVSCESRQHRTLNTKTLTYVGPLRSRFLHTPNKPIKVHFKTHIWSPSKPFSPHT